MTLRDPYFNEAFVCRIAHELNRVFCEAVGDDSQVSWDAAPNWQRQSVLDGLLNFRLHRNVSPRGSHTSWLKLKQQEGWSYGPVKDAERKTHPCFRPYEDLPFEQQMKDFLFLAVMKAFNEFEKERLRNIDIEEESNADKGKNVSKA